MDVTTLPSISDLFEGVDQWGEVLTLLPVLVLLELVLSADNAIALAALARNCKAANKERQALSIGISLALVLRIGLIVVAQWVLKNPLIQLVAGSYLLWLFIDHVRPKQLTELQPGLSEQEDAAPAASLIRTVVLLALTDLAFSIDSVAAAVAISDQIILVSTGAVIGIIALRFTSELFIRWLEIFPRLERAGFLAVAFVGLRLIIHVVLPELQQPDWMILVVVAFLFSWGFSMRLAPSLDTEHAG